MKDTLSSALGVDALSIAISNTEQASQTQKLISTYRETNLVMPGLHLVDTRQPIPEPVADDGQPLTLERRQEIARQRVALVKFDENGVPDYSEANPDIQAEPLGQSAGAALRQTVIKVTPVKADPNLNLDDRDTWKDKV